MTDGESWNKYQIADTEFEIRYSVDGKNYTMAGKATARVITSARYESYQDIPEILRTGSGTKVELILKPSESGVQYTVKMKKKEKVIKTVTIETIDHSIGEVLSAREIANIPAHATFKLNFRLNHTLQEADYSVTFSWDEEL
jgi:hypothetical protein